MVTTCSGPLWSVHCQYGVQFSLDHLCPTVEQHTFPPRPAPRGRESTPAHTFPVRIHYSHHCFTVSMEQAGHCRAEEIYVDSSRRESRVFCPRRWELSKILPRIMRQLLGKGLPCYQTRHRNYLVVELGAAAPGIYRVYFSVKRWTTGVVVFVESAYPTVEGPVHIGSGHRQISINAVLANAR